MQLDLNNLPTDTALLHRLVRDMASVVEQRDSEIDRLELIIKQLQRARFGRSSERIDADQLALGLEDVETDKARAEAAQKPRARPRDRKPRRKPLPDHLPRVDVCIDVGTATCACGGGALHPIGESVSEMLDWIPARLRVIRIRRPKYGCRACGTVSQAPAPERPTAGGLATPALLAQVLVSKYCDHTPLYRQSQIFARLGVDLDRSTLAGWVGGACWWLDALYERLCANVFASDHLFADDTPVPVLDPGRGRTKTGRLWVYARDQRSWGGSAAAAAVFVFAPDRKRERPAAHLKNFSGVLHVDGYAGFGRLRARGDVILAACWVHYLESDLILSVETEGPTCRGISPKRLKIKNRKSKSELQERKEIWLGFQWLGRVRLDTGMLTRFEGRRTSSSGLSPSRLVVAARTRWSRIATKPVPGCRSATDAPALSHTPPLGRSPEFIWSPGEPKTPIHWRWERIPKIRFDSR